MRYTHSNDIRPCSLQAKQQGANVFDVNLTMQKLHASTYTPLQLQRLQSYIFNVTPILFALHHWETLHY